MIADQTSELIGDTGLDGLVKKRAVAAVVVNGHVLRRVGCGHDDVEQAVAVEIVHDGAAGHIHPIKPGGVALVAKPPDVEFGIKKRSSAMKIGIEFSRIFTESRECDFAKPANSHVVGEKLEVLCEVFYSQARAGGIGVHGRLVNRNNAGAFGPASDAIVVLGTAHRCHALQENHRAQINPNRARLRSTFSRNCKSVS